MLTKVAYPLKSSWVVLIIATAPIWLFGIYCILDNDLFEGFVSLSVSAWIILYNLSVRLSFDGSELELRRYGMLVWRVGSGDIQIKSGLGGEIKLIPSYIISSNQYEFEQYVLKSWFSEVDFRRVVDAAGAEIKI